MNSSLQPDVIPAEAGIQSFHIVLDPGFRRGDGLPLADALALEAEHVAGRRFDAAAFAAAGRATAARQRP